MRGIDAVALLIAVTLSAQSLAAHSQQAAKADLGFIVDVSLSPKARAKLTTLGETITVAAAYYGDPTPAAQKHGDQIGQINLGRETAIIPAAGGRAVLTGARVRGARLSWLAPPGPQVNVNVFSSRRSGPNNLLDCAFFQDTVARAQRAPVSLACKLIGEP